MPMERASPLQCLRVKLREEQSPLRSPEWNPADIFFTDLHTTGTFLGDPIEVSGAGSFSLRTTVQGKCSGSDLSRPTWPLSLSLLLPGWSCSAGLFYWPYIRQATLGHLSGGLCHCFVCYPRYNNSPNKSQLWCSLFFNSKSNPSVYTLVRLD